MATRTARVHEESYPDLRLPTECLETPTSLAEVGEDVFHMLAGVCILVIPAHCPKSSS